MTVKIKTLKVHIKQKEKKTNQIVLLKFLFCFFNQYFQLSDEQMLL